MTTISPAIFSSNSDASPTLLHLFWSVLTVSCEDWAKGPSTAPPWLENCIDLRDVDHTDLSLAACDPFQPYMDPWKRDIWAGGFTSYSAPLSEVGTLLVWDDETLS